MSPKNYHFLLVTVLMFMSVLGVFYRTLRKTVLSLLGLIILMLFNQMVEQSKGQKFYRRSKEPLQELIARDFRWGVLHPLPAKQQNRAPPHCKF